MPLRRFLFDVERRRAGGACDEICRCEGWSGEGLRRGWLTVGLRVRVFNLSLHFGKKGREGGYGGALDRVLTEENVPEGVRMTPFTIEEQAVYDGVDKFRKKDWMKSCLCWSFVFTLQSVTNGVLVCGDSCPKRIAFMGR